MQPRVEHNKIKQQVAYHRADYQAWHHLDGEVEIVKEAERLGLRCIVMTVSFNIYIQDHDFLKSLVRTYIQIVIAPGISLERLTYLATIHDEAVRNQGLFGSVDPEGEIIGKRTSFHVKILDYILDMGNTLGMSIYGPAYFRSLIFDNIIILHCILSKLL